MDGMMIFVGLISAVEYFHGGNGVAIGAAYQTWRTGLIAGVIRCRHG